MNASHPSQGGESSKSRSDFDAYCDVAAPMYEELILLRSALDHIAKTCRQSRSQTRRLRWIEQRAEFALAGKAYDNEAFDLPKTLGSTPEKLSLENKRLREQLAGASS